MHEFLVLWLQLAYFDHFAHRWPFYLSLLSRPCSVGVCLRVCVWDLRKRGYRKNVIPVVWAGVHVEERMRCDGLESLCNLFSLDHILLRCQQSTANIHPPLEYLPLTRTDRSVFELVSFNHLAVIHIEHPFIVQDEIVVTSTEGTEGLTDLICVPIMGLRLDDTNRKEWGVLDHRPPTVNSQGRTKIAKNVAIPKITREIRAAIVWGERARHAGRWYRVDIGGTYSFRLLPLDGGWLLLHQGAGGAGCR